MNIDLSELTAYTKRFRSIFTGQERTEILRVVGKRMGVAAEAQVSDYPEPSRKPLPAIYPRTRKDGTAFLSKFKSAKQQGKVFVLAKEGRIPYERSGLLGRSTTSKVVEVTADSVTTAIGNSAPHAARVIGDEGQQSLYHRGTWQTLSEDINRGAAKIRQAAVSAYTTEIDRRLER
jgi:hypothetical protein